MFRWFASLLIIFIFCMVGYYAVRDARRPTHTASQAAWPVYLNAAKARVGEVPIVATSVGSLQAWQRINVAPEIGGVVSKIYFTPGERVRAGQKLIQLNDAIYKADLKAARSDFLAAKSAYDHMLLLRKKRPASVSSASSVTAAYQQALADLNQAQVDESKMLLVAPFAGVVSAGSVDVGEYVAPGTSLAFVVDRSELKLSYALPEKYLHQLKSGQVVRITTNALPGKVFKGVLYYVAPSVDPQTRTIPLLAKFNNPDGLLTPGLFANVEQVLRVNKKAVLIPERAILPSISGPTVFVIRDQHAHLDSVILGAKNKSDVQVVRGLKAGDVVAVSGLLKLRDGAKVDAKLLGKAA